MNFSIFEAAALNILNKVTISICDSDINSFLIQQNLTYKLEKSNKNSWLGTLNIYKNPWFLGNFFQKNSEGKDKIFT